MKFSNILTFIAGIAMAYSAVIPESYNEELSISEDIENAINVDVNDVAEIVENSDGEASDDYAVLSADENDVSVELSDDENVEVTTTTFVQPTTTVEIPTTTVVDEPTNAPLKLTPGPVSCSYKKKDIDDKFNNKSDNKITCKGTDCKINGKGAVVSNGVVTITSAGNYILQGELKGQVSIEAPETDYIHLILDNISIKSEAGPAIKAISAEKVTLTLVGQNSLIDSENYVINDKEPDASLYADTDLSINGNGDLDITGNFGTALHCTKNLKLVAGNINVEAKDKGIKAKNSICINETNVNINSVNTAIKVTNTKKADKGYIVIDNGNVTISTKNDAIHGETHLTVNDGFIDILDCNEGMEAQMIDILGGEIHIKTHNDGMNASMVNKVKQEKPMGPPPNFDPNSPPPMPVIGPEATDGSMYINIVGGKTFITAQDDTDIDGIDSNGILYIGGQAEVYVDLQYGKIYGDFAALDSDGYNLVTGDATVVAASAYLSWEDAAQFMTEEEAKNRPPPPPPSANARGTIYRPYIYIMETEMTKQPGKTKITLEDDDGSVIASYVPDHSYDRILIVSPKLVAGKSYKLTAGSFVMNVEASPSDEGDLKAPSVDGF
ncbi:hypothetical protein BCR36DRAFT_584115 [Piromyces finnis]|uniref:Carbohydrate-binding domain-containing protein n=1 Tax=Piromyces finnis TaxID=1754191 RepID=A0A1Y1V7A6_9FUNG|nr:hypothetical protein BCR36DRAFT_584115 [Piromyces finnis]|eukprot:ORX49006.1 hypothetical protein BCR36DRAFT_584115 [Piromyces finnis]